MKKSILFDQRLFPYYPAIILVIVIITRLSFAIDWTSVLSNTVLIRYKHYWMGIGLIIILLTICSLLYNKKEIKRVFAIVCFMLITNTTILVNMKMLPDKGSETWKIKKNSSQSLYYTSINTPSKWGIRFKMYTFLNLYLRDKRFFYPLKFKKENDFLFNLDTDESNRKIFSKKIEIASYDSHLSIDNYNKLTANFPGYVIRSVNLIAPRRKIKNISHKSLVVFIMGDAYYNSDNIYLLKLTKKHNDYSIYIFIPERAYNWLQR